MRSRQVFTERLDVTAPVETSRHPVSTRRRLVRSADLQRSKFWRRAESPVIPREARGWGKDSARNVIHPVGVYLAARIR
jgi:hypothetical protein